MTALLRISSIHPAQEIWGSSGGYLIVFSDQQMQSSTCSGSPVSATEDLLRPSLRSDFRKVVP